MRKLTGSHCNCFRIGTSQAFKTNRDIYTTLVHLSIIDIKMPVYVNIIVYVKIIALSGVVYKVNM